MRKSRYRFHPSEYELGENEKFYSDMEAKGWRLAKRGRRLSKFTPTEPNQARYRIEVAYPAFLEDAGLTEGQLAVFEDCGWEYVDSRGFLHIFRAPQGSDAPEFYADPRQQAATLKRVRRSLWWAWGITGACVLALLGLYGLFWDGLDGIRWEIVRRYLEIPTLVLGYAIWLLWAFYDLLAETWLINRTYFRLKRGLPLDHNPKSPRTLRRLLGHGLPILAALCLALSAAQLVFTRSRDVPQTPDGPYLLLGDFGFQERQESGRDSSVTHTRSFAADYWDVCEYASTSNDTVWMYQDVYRLHDAGMAPTMARAIIERSTFGRSLEAFTPLDIPGLDAAWTCRQLEVVAVKGNLVAYVTFPGSTYGELDAQGVCHALAARWAAW